MIDRPDPSIAPEYYRYYINLVPEPHLLSALEAHSRRFLEYLTLRQLHELDFRYAPGKWALRQVVQHIVDTERIFAYRAMCISRGDQTSLPGFDENAYADHDHTARNSLEELTMEFQAIRLSTILLLKKMDNMAIDRMGSANGLAVSPRIIGWMIAGHGEHHLRVLQDRYTVGT